MPPTIVEVPTKEYADDQQSSEASSRASSECYSAEEELQDETEYESYITQLTR